MTSRTAVPRKSGISAMKGKRLSARRSVSARASGNPLLDEERKSLVQMTKEYANENRKSISRRFTKTGKSKFKRKSRAAADASKFLRKSSKALKSRKLSARKPSKLRIGARKVSCLLQTASLAGTRSRNVSARWNMAQFTQDSLTFSMTEMITSKGTKKGGEKLRGRYLEIQKFPDADGPGKGKYFLQGAVRSCFTFSGGETGVFDASQANTRPFHLEPLIDEQDRPVGFVWRFPDEYPKFRAEFGLSEAARFALRDIRLSRKRASTFGKFTGKFANRPKTDRQNTGASAFADWQSRFQLKRKGMNQKNSVDKLQLPADKSESQE